MIFLQNSVVLLNPLILSCNKTNWLRASLNNFSYLTYVYIESKKYVNSTLQPFQIEYCNFQSIGLPFDCIGTLPFDEKSNFNSFLDPVVVTQIF